jgi:hypothetical protein
MVMRMGKNVPVQQNVPCSPDVLPSCVLCAEIGGLDVLQRRREGVHVLDAVRIVRRRRRRRDASGEVRAAGDDVAVRPLVQLQVVVREHQLLVLGRAVRADRRRPRPLVDEEDFGQHDDAEHGEEDDHDAERQVGSLAQPTRGARSSLLAAHPRQFCEKSIQKIRIIFQK